MTLNVHHTNLISTHQVPYRFGIFVCLWQWNWSFQNLISIHFCSLYCLTKWIFGRLVLCVSYLVAWGWWACGLYKNELNNIYFISPKWWFFQYKHPKPILHSIRSITHISNLFPANLIYLFYLCSMICVETCDFSWLT